MTEDELNTRKVNDMKYISKESVVSLIKMYGNNANDEQKFILADILSDINDLDVKEIKMGNDTISDIVEGRGLKPLSPTK